MKRELHFTHVSLFIDSSRANPPRYISNSKKRCQKRKALKDQYKQSNDRYISNLSHTFLLIKIKLSFPKAKILYIYTPKTAPHRSRV